VDATSEVEVEVVAVVIADVDVLVGLIVSVGSSYLFDLMSPKTVCTTVCKLPCMCEPTATIDVWAGSGNCLFVAGEQCRDSIRGCLGVCNSSSFMSSSY
jgi:hypothetical protein